MGATPLKSPPPGGGNVLSPPTVLPMPKQLSRKRGRHSTAEAYAHMMAAHAAMKRARREIRCVSGRLQRACLQLNFLLVSVGLH